LCGFMTCAAASYCNCGHIQHLWSTGLEQP